MKACKCGCTEFLIKGSTGGYSDPTPMEFFDPVKYPKAVCLGCNALLSPETSPTPITDAACRMVDSKGWTREYDEVSTKEMEKLELDRNKVVVERDALQGRVIELECALKWWLGERMKGFGEDQYGKRNMRKILNEGSLPVYGETK